MYYGKVTPKLEKLYKEYHDMFGCYPFGHMELEYGADEYTDFVRDIKKALRTKQLLTDFVE